MNKTIFDLEQQIMGCWQVTDDIALVTEWFGNDPCWQDLDGKVQDAIMNKYFGIQEIYALKFEKMYSTFEKVCEEYHEFRKLSGQNREEELMDMFDDEH